MAKRKRKRLARVSINLSFVVDLNNADMVQDAKETLYKKLLAAHKAGNLNQYVRVELDPKALVDQVEDWCFPPRYKL